MGILIVWILRSCTTHCSEFITTSSSLKLCALSQLRTVDCWFVYSLFWLCVLVFISCSSSQLDDRFLRRQHLPCILKLSQVLYHQGFYTFIILDFHICVGCTGFLANIVKLLDLSTCGHYIPSNCTHSKVQVQSILDSKTGESFLLFAVWLVDDLGIVSVVYYLHTCANHCPFSLGFGNRNMVGRIHQRAAGMQLKKTEHIISECSN